MRSLDQSHAVRKLVLNALKPESFANSTQGIPPEYEHFGNSNFWVGTLNFATSIHSRLPFLAVLERSSVWRTLPDDVFAIFSQALTYERMVLANLDYELEESLAILKRAEITVILLKGMDLGRRLYPSRVFRPMTDVDLLVPSDRFEETLSHFLSGPYQKIGPFPAGRIRLEVGRTKDGAVVEIHKKLQVGDSDEMTLGLWNRAQSGAIPGLDSHVQVLSAQDYFSYLVRHSAIQHLIESPIWLNDLHYLVQSEEFRSTANWQQIVSEALGEGTAGALWFVLRILKLEWGTSIPDQALLYSNRTVSPFKQKLLLSLIDLNRLFSIHGRSRAWVIGSRFILRDHMSDAFSYGIQRIRSRGW
ncbi:MAG: nucleotidyltransferase family protein, partial [Bdellovibrionota bacterium]